MNAALLTAVAWGPRALSVDECADRWLATGRRLASVDPGLLGRWVWAVEDDDGEFEEIELDTADILRERVDAGALDRLAGFGFEAWNGQMDDQEVTLRGRAGLVAASAPLNLVHLTVSPESPAEIDRWTRIADAALAGLVEIWQPDYGRVGTIELDRAQRPADREPSAGYVTYLSPGRRVTSTRDLPGTWRDTPDGGQLVSLLVPGAGLPSVDAVTELGTALRAAGALAAVPADRPLI